MAWAQGRIYYNQKNASGVFDGWSANPDGGDARCVTCGAVYPAGTQHGISDVTADGRYALATVERSRHWPVSDGMYMAAPGNGAYNDLWLQKSDGSQAWRLSNSITTGASALIWPRFDSTGTRVVWSEQWRWGMPYGGWRIIVADIKWSNGVPSLANKKTFQSTRVPRAVRVHGRRLARAVRRGRARRNVIDEPADHEPARRPDGYSRPPLSA